MEVTCGIRVAKSRLFPAGRVVAVLIFSAFTAAKADYFDFFDCFDGKYMRAQLSIVEDIRYISIHQCAQKCVEGADRLREGQCLSFNYHKPSRQCTLITDNRATVQPSFFSNLDNYIDYEYCEMKDILNFFIARPGYVQDGHDDAIVRPPTVTPRICALRCLRGAENVPAGSCLSFEIKSIGRPDNCLLSRDTPETTGLPLSASPRFNYYQRNIDVCFHNSCVHGYCTSEDGRITCVCDTGWGGDTCDTVCPPGQFGLGCNNTCRCASGGSVCDTETGVCSSGGCIAGWQGNNCQIQDYCTPNPCINGACVNGASGYTCSCHAGWQGANCDAACTAGTFGLKCAETCHCAGGTSVCDVQTGVCSTGGCAAGWSGPNCQTVCFLGTFGPGCSETCHCADGISVCDIQTGECSTSGCTAGWSGPNCQTACQAGQFGLGCNGTCHCASGGSVCDTETGVCTSGRCSAGWQGNNCQEACPPGQFGPGCTGTCHCASGGSVCDTETGVCTSGGCSAGWEGSNCQTGTTFFQ
uniref:EGF-like domain-containing protein n=1 Tax=Branchiostoma floridae TaxID=7739 RepID=C3ZJ84_BRAFL|eukprot:XP_002591404.1 hypothetical protein BRAFLDRAFT_69967 [Branchiostoma floridae]